jgi:membrane protein YqaA with SNARE-associated domain
MAEVTLFLSAFLAATLLPFSSEAAFVVALKSDMPLLHAMLSASLGNVLAVVVNYYLGYFLYLKTKRKLLASKSGKRAYHLMHRYGYYTLLLSWLPIIGDPLTIVAGLLRLRFIYFLLIAGSLRVARYYFLAVMV